MGRNIEKAVWNENEPHAEAKKRFQERKQAKNDLLTREKELMRQLAKEIRTDPTAANETRARLAKIQGELKRLAEENKRGKTLQQIRRSTALANLALTVDKAKSHK